MAVRAPAESGTHFAGRKDDNLLPGDESQRAADHRARRVQRLAGYRGAVFQQDPVLLLHRPDVEARREREDAGDLLCRPAHPQGFGSRDAGNRRDHPELHILPGGNRRFGPLEAIQGNTREAARMAAKNHDYHLVEPDIWPLIGAFSAFALFGGAVMWFHDNHYGPFVGGLGVAGVLITMYSWWANTVREAHTGYHTPVVQLHL